MSHPLHAPAPLPLLELFKEQACLQIAKLSSHLPPAGGRAIPKEDLGQLNAAVRSLKASARMVHLNELVEITRLLEEQFTIVARMDSHSLEPYTELLVDVMTLLSELPRTPASEIIQWVHNNHARFQDLSVRTALQTNQAQPGSGNKVIAAATNTEAAIDSTLLELFRIDAETQIAVINEQLLKLEKAPEDKFNLESLMRAAHSIKGAARVIGLTPVVTLAHALEDCFCAAQGGKITLGSPQIDVMLNTVDLITNWAQYTTHDANNDTAGTESAHQNALENLRKVLTASPLNLKTHEGGRGIPSSTRDVDALGSTERVLRISTQRINKLMELSGELLVNSGWIHGYSDSLLSIKRKHGELIQAIDKLRNQVERTQVNEQWDFLFSEVQRKSNECRQMFTHRLSELDEFERRSTNLAGRLNHEVLASRMRPFEDGTKGIHRAVRDLARDLGKEVQLEILGLTTQVDRDILENLEVPLNQIIRNAVDHGIELPDERERLGKPRMGTLKIEAVHSSGMLSVSVGDDGRGVDLENLRHRVVKKNMVNEVMAQDLTESELLEFLFLPGFSTRDEVTELSGRGVGLDVVHTAIQDMRGKIRSVNKQGRGLTIHLQLPLTLSVVRCLLVTIVAEPYAFPLARINAILHIQRQQLQVMENRQYISYESELVPLIDAAQVLTNQPGTLHPENLHVIVVGDRHSNFGIVVEGLLGEFSLAVRPLDAKLGKVRDISSAAILDDGSPTLIVDVDDMLRSIENLISGKRLGKLESADPSLRLKPAKRVLVVDDSLTVREVERKLLESRGYRVDVAVDGMDGWNGVRLGSYDLVITDVDMPRLNGFEFVTLIKNDSKLKSTPVMIVSYKDRPEDRERGLTAGADYYLAKGSFHDDSLIDAVVDLIGAADV